MAPRCGAALDAVNTAITTYPTQLDVNQRKKMKHLLALSLFVPVLGFAAPQFEASGEGVKVVVHSEKCALKEISNLPYRATWTEKGKTTEGCAGPHPIGVVLFYFADKTIVVVPMQEFVKVTGA